MSRGKSGKGKVQEDPEARENMVHSESFWEVQAGVCWAVGRGEWRLERSYGAWERGRFGVGVPGLLLKGHRA